MTKRKKVSIVIIVIFVAWIIIGIVDFTRVRSFEKPLFCISVETADDGGSGHYVGLGYSFNILGSFMPEDELPGISFKWF